MPDAWRRAGADDVAGLQAHEAAQIADEIRNAKHHRLRGAVLITMSVDLEPEAQVLAINHFVARDEPRTNRTERVRALAFHPLTGAFELKRALGEIIDDAESGDVRERVLLADVL